MLNGLKKTLERKDPARGRRWRLVKKTAVYGVNDESFPQGWPRYHPPEADKSAEATPVKQKKILVSLGKRGRPITTEHAS